MLRNMSPLSQRLIMSLLSIIFLFVIITLSPLAYFNFLFVLVGTVIISFALWEFYYIGKAKGYQPQIYIGILGTIAFVFATFLSQHHPQLYLLPNIILGMILLITFLFYFAKDSEPLVNIALTMLGLIYITLPLSFWIKINYFFSQGTTQDGRWWLFYLLAVVKITDAAAFFGGKMLGRHKLAPYISPGKTWEGAFIGLMAGILTSVGFYFLSSQFFTNALQLNLRISLWLGTSISLLGQLGDLAESLLKRDGGIKDSNQLPGLGGALDIVDSLVFASPFLYLFLILQEN